jgi:hypothetical protein
MLRKHRDLYKYIHDQSVRLMNSGYTPREIAERVKLPASPRKRVVDARVLRHALSQREGRLSEVLGLVRRQSCESQSAAAGRIGAALRGIHGGAAAR